MITREEAAQFKAKLDARNDDLTRPAEPSLYFDDRTVEPIRGELRSSIIVEPTDGLVPGNARYKERVTQLRRDSAALFARVDIIVMPSAAALPWPAHEAYPRCIDGQEVGPRGHAVYTGWVNAAGLPALALPAAPSAEGLPIGFQLIGRYGSDDELLDLGSNYETWQPWADRWPAL